MIDCNIAKNYFLEKKRMTKRAKKMGDVNLTVLTVLYLAQITIKGYYVQILKYSIPKRRLRMYRGGVMNIHGGLV